MLNGNPLTGRLILVGIVYSSWQGAVWFLVGAMLGTIMGKLFKSRKELVEAGIFGFAGGYSGVLVGSNVL
jgi:urea transporter